MPKIVETDPLGRPVWSYKNVRRPSVDDGQTECNMGDTGVYEIVDDKDLYQIKIESWNYEPEEITINRDPEIASDIIVSGKKLDRETKQVIPQTVFSRRFSLPSDVDYKDLKKIYTASGVVVIEAPRSAPKY